MQEGKKLEVKNLVRSTGGGATNSAVSFKRLGHTVKSFFAIADDQAGHAITTVLAQEQIDINNIVRTNKAATGTSFIIPCPSGDRTVLVYRGANLTLTKDVIPYQAIDHCDQRYIIFIIFITFKN